MAEGGRVEFAAKFVIDAHEQVEVEGAVTSAWSL